MGEKIKALAVHDQGESVRPLAKVLDELGIEVQHASGCREVSQHFTLPNPAEVIITTTALRDGRWEDVVHLAQRSERFLPVIVVSRVVDLQLYLEALGQGAFDFIAPAFLASEFSRIVRSAMYKELVSGALETGYAA